MTEEQNLIDHYRAVRNRLRRPPNPVVDLGINLKREKLPPVPIEILPLIPILKVVDYSQYPPFQRTDLTFCYVLDYIAGEFNISAKTIRMRRRVRDITLPRSIAIWIGCKIKLRSLTEMGRYLGMDHTTIMNSRNRIRHLMAGDDTFKERVLSLEVSLLAAYDQSALSALSKPHLGSSKEQQDGDKGPDEIGKVPSVDH